jgi:hypothetical protein
MLSGGFFEVLTENSKKHIKKRRSEEEKYGKYKWVRILIRRNMKDIVEIKRMLRGLSRGLSSLMDFDSEYLLGMVCQDSRDQAILDMLRAAGAEGLLPRDIHARVAKFGLKYHHITRRIKRMNKRMQNEIGERVADKVGRNWALSDFMFHNWTTKKNEIETDMTENKY